MRTLLLVDDEFAMVEALSALLEEEGYRVVTAANGEEGLARVAEATPDLVLLDVMMPRMGGYEMLRRLRADDATRAVPVILMSAVLDRSRAGEPPVALLAKPFTFDALLARLAELLPPE